MEGSFESGRYALSIIMSLRAWSVEDVETDEAFISALP